MKKSSYWTFLISYIEWSS